MLSVAAASPLAWAMESVALAGGSPFSPYPYQARLLADRNQRLLVLKARQVGISFAAAVLVAHHLLHHDRAVALVVSRDQEAAGNFVRMVYDVLDGLSAPPAFERRGVFEAELANGSRIVSQAATTKAGRGLTASIVVLDEFAFARDDHSIYRAVLPTLSRGGRLVCISTPDGVGNLFYRLWNGDEGGDWSRHRVHWRDCPAFDAAWYERQRPNYTDASWASEFDLDFSTSGQAVFAPGDVDAMAFGWLGEQPAQPGGSYISGWDIGRRRDATVGVTLDVTAAPYQVVRYERLLEAPFATIQGKIRARAQDYPGRTVVESNNTGDPVIEGLTGINVSGFTTTALSKANGLQKLVRMVEQGQLKAGQEQLLSELRAYQWDDSRLIQDSVMALMIACWPVLELHGPRLAPAVAATPGRVHNAESGVHLTPARSGSNNSRLGGTSYRSRARRNNGRMADLTVEMRYEKDYLDGLKT